jgi:subtilase family serine protease
MSRNPKASCKPNRSSSEFMQPLEQRRMMSVTPAIDFLPDASSATVAGYSPSTITSAYGISSVSFNSGKTAANGAGQTIAIVDAYNDPNIAADLKTYDTKYGLAAANLKVVNQTGGSILPASNASWAEEISLDVEMVHAVAPGASILLVETNSSSNADLLAGVNYARDAAGVSVVSLSWGGSEFAGETSDDSYFTTPSGHTGVTFVAASGDDGSAGGVDWPASSPDVLSVGGTSLNVTSSGAYSTETGWADSGGGASVYEGEPEYQSKVQSLDVRSVPDVSADANPYTGVAVYDSYSYDGYSGWLEFGGTSAAAPQWAGIISIADQGRALDKLGTLNGTTNTLPTLYSLESNATTYANDFHDITSGATSYSISAGKGYDEVTGLGSPKANDLIPALVSSKTNTALAVTAVPVHNQPHRPPFGFFVSTTEQVFPGSVLLSSGNVFTATLGDAGQLSVEKSFTAFAIAQTYAITAASVSSLPIISSVNAAPFAIPGADTAGPVDLASLTPHGVDASIEAITQQMVSQAVQGELVGVSDFARDMLSRIVRDFAADLVPSAAASTAASMIEAVIAPGNGWESAAVLTGVAIAAGAYLQKESDRERKIPQSVFAGNEIEFSL